MRDPLARGSLLDSGGVVVPQGLISDQHVGHAGGTGMPHQRG